MPEEILQLIAYSLVAILAVAIAWWCIACMGLSMLSGWRRLSKRFRSSGAPSDKARRAGPFLFGVKMRNACDYSNTIRLTCDDRALYLSLLLPLRIGHPSLSIPWKEIEWSTTKHRSQDFFVLTLGRKERIPLRLAEGIAAKLGLLERANNEALTH